MIYINIRNKRFKLRGKKFNSRNSLYKAHNIRKKID